VIRFFFPVFFLFSSLAFADQRWSVRAGYGYSDENDLGQILTFDPKPHYANTSAATLSGGYLLRRDAWELPLDWYAMVGVSRFYENGYQDDFFEMALYLKAFWRFEPFSNVIRLGVGEGFSYAGGIPYVEKLEAEKEGDNNSRLLNYLDLSLDIDFGRLVGWDSLENCYIGYALKHRSGIYGLINSVRRGGSNYNLLYLEYQF